VKKKLINDFILALFSLKNLNVNFSIFFETGQLRISWWKKKSD